MGRRRSRKRQRQREKRNRLADTTRQPEPRPVDPFDLLYGDDEPAVALLSGMRDTRGGDVLTCGTCREFLPDYESGRGECLHPGSGVLSPWDDSPGCPFHSRARR